MHGNIRHRGKLCIVVVVLTVIFGLSQIHTVPISVHGSNDTVSARILFDEGQLATICHDAEHLLSDIDPDKKIIDAWRRLDAIRDYCRNIVPASNSDRE